ncbi:uncharacterized protein B0T15DRAFT_75580 [Chaetomium strumarium]|uniref:Uncharacterized protein n=1 Tax=Chaetomium strumarium TaxID=1170767 RepID=A0AAJ0H466_9PEZI|nr:hypothetical protein B0T15DRAFT_75580 [Chaetomium strumarium]
MALALPQSASSALSASSASPASSAPSLILQSLWVPESENKALCLQTSVLGWKEADFPLPAWAVGLRCKDTNPGTITFVATMAAPSLPSHPPPPQRSAPPSFWLLVPCPPSPSSTDHPIHTLNSNRDHRSLLQFSVRNTIFHLPRDLSVFHSFIVPVILLSCHTSSLCHLGVRLESRSQKSPTVGPLLRLTPRVPLLTDLTTNNSTTARQKTYLTRPAAGLPSSTRFHRT